MDFLALRFFKHFSTLTVTAPALAGESTRPGSGKFGKAVGCVRVSGRNRPKFSRMCGPDRIDLNLGGGLRPLGPSGAAAFPAREIPHSSLVSCRLRDGGGREAALPCHLATTEISDLSVIVECR